MPTRIERPGRERLASDLIERWRAVTAAVAADQLGSRHADPGIRAIRSLGAGTRLVGSAVTAACKPQDYGPVHHAIGVAERGDVLVIGGGGRSDAAMIGELLSTAARLKGIAGLVLDGALRDVATLAEWHDFHVFTRWVTPRGPSTMQEGAVNVSVECGGVTVEPYDLVIGDDDGVVFVPHGMASEKVAACEARLAAEAGWEAELASGRSTLDVFNVPPATR